MSARSQHPLAAPVKGVTVWRTVRCNAATHGRNMGFCSRHADAWRHVPDDTGESGGRMERVDTRPCGELPYDPASVMFCRAIKRLR